MEDGSKAVPNGHVHDPVPTGEVNLRNRQETTLQRGTRGIVDEGNVLDNIDGIVAQIK